jgi:hypothetical protein
VTLDLDGRQEIKMSLRTLTKSKSSTLAKYFMGDEEAKDKLSEWIKKENETRYFIGGPLLHLIKTDFPGHSISYIC